MSHAPLYLHMFIALLLFLGTVLEDPSIPTFLTLLACTDLKIRQLKDSLLRL